MVDFSYSDRVLDWQGRIREFVASTVIPREQDAFAKGVDDDLRRELQAAARDAGLWAPQALAELGGGGFTHAESAVLLEEAGYSLLGPLALNCHAPDEGNIHLLSVIATDQQKARYLKPLVDGDTRSCFAMTEPPPGAGSDPSAMRTVARRTDGGWVVNGEKHLITGAEEAGFAILMVSDGASGSTMFLVEPDNPGWQVREHARTLDGTMVGGHCRVEITDLFVRDDAVLGEPGRGFAYAQARLAPARLTHCMRWLGAARRAHDIAVDRAVTRELFGTVLAEHGQAQAMIADNEIDMVACRAMIAQSCWELDQGRSGTESSSRTKVFVSEAVHRVVDRAAQLCGGMGISEELVVGRILADIRGFRIYDGANEVHRMSIAKRVVKRTRDRKMK